MSWAYEWDKTLAPGATLTIAKEKNIEAVPEPGTLPYWDSASSVSVPASAQATHLIRRMEQSPPKTANLQVNNLPS